MYLEAKAYYAKPQWTRPALLSKRLRTVLRLIALEERLQELQAGALPPRIMLTLRLLSGYENATSIKYYQHRYRKPQFPERKDTDDPLQSPQDTDRSDSEAPPTRED